MQDITQYPLLVKYSSKAGKLAILTKNPDFAKKQHPQLRAFVKELNKLTCSSLFCLSIKKKKKIKQAKLNRIVDKHRRLLSYHYSWINRCPTDETICFGDIFFSLIELRSPKKLKTKNREKVPQKDRSKASITPTSSRRENFAFDTQMAKTLIINGTKN